MIPSHVDRIWSRNSEALFPMVEVEEEAQEGVSQYAQYGEPLTMAAGQGCIDCRTLCGLALPYLPFDTHIVARASRSDADRNNIAEILTESHENRSQKAIKIFTESISVDSVMETEDRLVAHMEGYRLEEFKAAHRGIQPKDLGCSSTEIVHPATKESIEVWWKPSSSEFLWECSAKQSAVKRRDAMPERVYEKQPEDTFAHMSTNLASSSGISAASVMATPSHSDIQRAVQKISARMPPPPASSPGAMMSPPSLAAPPPAASRVISPTNLLTGAPGVHVVSADQHWRMFSNSQIAKFAWTLHWRMFSNMRRSISLKFHVSPRDL